MMSLCSRRNALISVEVVGDQGRRHQLGELGDEQLLGRVADRDRVVDHQRLRVDPLEQVRGRDVGQVERRILAHQHDVEGRAGRASRARRGVTWLPRSRRTSSGRARGHDPAVAVAELGAAGSGTGRGRGAAPRAPARRCCRRRCRSRSIGSIWIATARLIRAVLHWRRRLRDRRPRELDTAGRGTLCPYRPPRRPTRRSRRHGLRPEQHLRPHPARRDPVQAGVRGRVRAGLPRHQPAGPGARPGDPEGRVRLDGRFHAPRPRREAIAGFFRAVGETARQLGRRRARLPHPRQSPAPTANQEVPHFHVHIFAGAPLGRMLKQDRGALAVQRQPFRSRRLEPNGSASTRCRHQGRVRRTQPVVRKLRRSSAAAPA